MSTKLLNHLITQLKQSISCGDSISQHWQICK